MRNRITLVMELIKNPKTVATVTQELAGHGWYSENHLADVTKLDVLAVLKQFENGALDASEIKAWANSVGGRTDIGFEFGEDGVVEESLYWLAKPEINGPINTALCQRIVMLYERRKAKRR